MTETATSVDVLIERLTTHPQEFFRREHVSREGETRIIEGVKWHRVITLLACGEKEGFNIWTAMFTAEEKLRFREAFMKAVRAELDAQIMQRLVSGGEWADVQADIDVKNAQLVAMQQAQQARMRNMPQMGVYGFNNAAQGSLGGSVSGGLLGTSYSEKVLLQQEDFDRQKDELKKAKSRLERLVDKVQKW